MTPSYPWQVIKILVDAAFSNGLSFRDLPKGKILFDLMLRKRGLTPEELDRFILGLIKASGRSELPILLAQTFVPESIDDYLTLAYTAPNLKEAIRLLSRYKWLLHPAVDLTLEERGDTAIIRYQSTDGFPLPEHYFYAEGLFSCVYHRTQDVTEGPLGLQKIHFRHPRTEHHHQYFKYFQCPVYHDMDIDAMYVDRDLIYKPYKTHDPEMNQHLQVQAEARHSQTQSFITQVNAILENQLKDESFGIEQLAAALAQSPRSLQRKLRQQGLTFSLLKSNLRIVKAKQMLLEDTHVESLAEQLGFLNAHSFRQFFKKSTGMTVNEFRNQTWDMVEPTSRHRQPAGKFAECNG